MKNILLMTVALWACNTAVAQTSHVDIIKEQKFRNSNFLMIYNGGYEIKSGNVMKSDLIVSEGDLVVNGTLEGEAVVDHGDLIVHATAVISGHVTVIDGKVIVHDNAFEASSVERMTWSDFAERRTAHDEEDIAFVPPLPELPTHDDILDEKSVRQLKDEMKGKMDDARKELDAINKEKRELPRIYIDVDDEDDVVVVDEDEWKERPWTREVEFRFPKPRDYRLTDYDNGYLAFDYNRVDGLYLGAKIDRRNDKFRFKPMRLYGEVGYAFGEKNVRYQVGLDRRWGRAFRFEIGGEVHDLTSSQDTWIVGHIENAVNAFLFKNDYKDHFRTRGYSFHVSQNLNPYLKITGTFRQDDYYSLNNHVNWSIFLPKQDFRKNPAIDDGRWTGFSLQAELDNVKFMRYGRKNFRRTGWHVVAEAEKGVPSWDSDFDYSRYTLNVVRYQPLSRWENLDVRMWLGTSTGDLPAQKSFYAGGISTMRGHDYKAFKGNHVALLNVEYRVSPNRFDRDRVLFIHPMNFILFMDNGYAWTSETNSYRHLYRGFDTRNVETDIGIGLGDEKDIVRLDLAKNVSQKGSDYKIMLRINYAF